MENKLISNKVVLYVLCAICLLMSGIELYLAFEGRIQVPNVLKTLVYIGLIYYAIFAYKKSHGNELKYLILFTVFLTSFECLFELLSPHEDVITTLQKFRYSFILIAVILMAYVAGRLDRIKQNKMILVIVLVLIALSVIFSYFSRVVISVEPLNPGIPDIPDLSLEKNIINIKNYLLEISRIDYFVQYLSITVAYLYRFKLHKEAGLVDAPKNKN